MAMVLYSSIPPNILTLNFMISKKRKRVLIIGYFGNRSGILEGQSVKTRNVSRLLKELGCDVIEFDTESVRFNKREVFVLLKNLASVEKVCILPSYNSLKWIVPAVYVLSKVFRYKVYLSTIGGRLHIYLKNMPIHRRIIGRIECVFSETHLLKKYLEEYYGFENAIYCPNFKFFDVRGKPAKHQEKGCLKLVFFARITLGKGLDVIFNYCHFLLDARRKDVSVDFYGMVEEKDRLYFEQELSKYPFANYCGVAHQDETTGILENYDAMILPTHFSTEGIPGSVIDAYIAGIPVIVSNWLYASELVDDDITGIIIPFENNLAEFINACESLLNDEMKLSRMKMSAHDRGLEYNAENVKHLLSQYFS